MQNARRALRLTTLIALTAVAAACGDNPRSIRMEGTVTLELGDRLRILDVGAYLDDERTDRRVFDELWAVLVDRRTSFDGLALTLSGVTGDGLGISLMPGIVLVLPTSLAEGESYATGTVNAPPGAPDDLPDQVGEWGARTLQQPGTPEIALRIVTYRTADEGIESNWVATAVNGALDVPLRADGRVTLVLDIVASDEAGEPVGLRGEIDVIAERSGGEY